MRARYAAQVTGRARLATDGATSLPHGLARPGGTRPTPPAGGAHSASLSARQTYKRGRAPPGRSAVPNEHTSHTTHHAFAIPKAVSYSLLIRPPPFARQFLTNWSREAISVRPKRIW